MNGKRAIELAGLIEANLELFDGILDSLHEAVRRDIPLLGRTANAALIIAGLLENYSTCLETVYLRISQFFENELQAERWHAELLEKMTLEIEGIRIPAVSRANYPRLLELLKSRHFKRYYFEAAYDWDRLDFLLKKGEEAHPIARADLERFVGFLHEL